MSATSTGHMKRDRAAEQNEIEQRRVEVATMMLAKVPYREMAQHLGVGLGTISRDVDAVRETWRRRAGAAYQAHVAEEVAKLDGLERRLIPDAFLGKIDAVHALLRLMERRSRLLGLDRPFKLEHSLSDEQQANLLADAIEGVLHELGIKRSVDVDRVVARHLELVAAEADGLTS